MKFDFNESNIGELCNGKVFSCFSTPVADSIDISEGKFFKICLYFSQNFSFNMAPKNKDNPQTFCRRGSLMTQEKILLKFINKTFFF